MSTSSERLHYMDNLRAILLLAGVFYHAALAYSPFFYNVWIVSDRVNSHGFDYLVNFSHIFRMPLFFVVAGFFTALLVQRRGMKAMLLNRVKRILLPFFIFWPLVAAGIIMSIGWALENVEQLPPVLSFAQSMENNPDAPAQTASLTHLWFLYYLMFFYLLTWLLAGILPQGVKPFITGIHPLFLVLLFPLLLIPGLSLTSVPYPAPDSFIPQLWSLGFFGLFFAYGYLLYFSDRQVQYFRRSWPLLILSSLAVFALLETLMPKPAELAFSESAMGHPLMMLCQVYIAVWMSVGGLILAKRFLDRRNKVMRLVADSSYWVYIAHLPVLFMIQVWLLDQDGGLLYKFLLSSMGTLFICFASYLLLVRWTPIGSLLNGKKKPWPR